MSKTLNGLIDERDQGYVGGHGKLAVLFVTDLAKVQRWMTDTSYGAGPWARTWERWSAQGFTPMVAHKNPYGQQNYLLIYSPEVS